MHSPIYRNRMENRHIALLNKNRMENRHNTTDRNRLENRDIAILIGIEWKIET